MPYNMPNPTLDVVTKYGTLQITFIDPETWRQDSYGRPRRDDECRVARVEGKAIINRIPVELSASVVYAMKSYENGKELPEPVRYMREDHQSGRGIRRMDVHAPFGSTDVTPGIRKAVDALIDSDIRQAYEAHPEFQREAVRARLAYAVDRAESERDDEYKKYQAAEQALLAARRAFAEFNDANPMTGLSR